MTSTEISERIKELLTEFVETDGRNSMAAHGGMKIYDAPLVAFAVADDELFETLKTPGIVSPNHLSPRDWIADAQTVISYYLPFTKEIRKSNSLAGYPSEEWVSSRIDGEAFNNLVRSYLVNLLKELGEEAVAPPLDKGFQIIDEKANWSERHVAYIAGLGTFGLHNGLITELGCAGRFGSVVTSLKAEPTIRPYTKYYEYCAYLMHGKCGACIKRCPVDAIKMTGKDIPTCKKFLFDDIAVKFHPRYGCGKCNVKVPCENGIVK